MKFDLEQLTYEFYKTYRLKNEFSIRKVTFSKNKQIDEIISRIFVYCKEGFCKKDKRNSLVIKPRAKTRICCTTQLYIKLNRQKSNYYVNYFVEICNHPLVMQECA